MTIEPTLKQEGLEIPPTYNYRHGVVLSVGFYKDLTIGREALTPAHSRHPSPNVGRGVSEERSSSSLINDRTTIFDYLNSDIIIVVLSAGKVNGNTLTLILDPSRHWLTHRHLAEQLQEGQRKSVALHRG